MKIPAFTLRGFKRPREVVGVALGKLEREVMNLTWQRGEISVRDVFQAFEERIAYTTLMTTLHRLYRKGVLDRRKQGRAFIYTPRVSPLEFEQGIARDLIAGLIGRAEDGVEPLLACIVDAVSEHDRTFLDALDRLIREKKEELRRSH
ncbi:MAG: BlaI/MecI/CopY family transcriptional regulator [Acidobacteriia bacterium]|nr:BlaI/MecI/CopY family transcriptional regulator [Terriglobia bacterium]